MYSVKADTEKNRLYIVLKGFMQHEEVVKAADAVIDGAKKLKTGFATVNDISEFKPASADGTKEIARAQAYLAKQGVARVIRVVGESVLGNMQLTRTAGYKADKAASVEEADKILDLKE